MKERKTKRELNSDKKIFKSQDLKVHNLLINILNSKFSIISEMRYTIHKKNPF